MDSKPSKKPSITPRFHVVYAWNRRVSRYLRIGSCYFYFSEFFPVVWISASSKSFRDLLLKNDFVLDKAISMPCSVWFGFSVGDEIFF